MPQYIHGSSQDEQERLEIQHELIGGTSFLPPLAAKMWVLDVGCGTGIVAREISSSVKLGKVIGIDIQEKQINRAIQRANKEGLSNVKFQIGKASYLEFPDEIFDVVYCRFLLEHVPNPLSVIKEMIRVTKQGGAIIACECKVDCCSETMPSLPHVKSALNALYKLQTMNGGNPHIGEKLGNLFQEAGLIDIKEDILISSLETPDQIKQYATGGNRLLKASETELIKNRLLSQEALNQAYSEWEKFSVIPQAKASFKLCRVQGIRPEK